MKDQYFADIEEAEYKSKIDLDSQVLDDLLLV
jgi:hypothetical protein